MAREASLIAIVRDYLERMLEDNKAMKALVLDQDTMNMVALAVSQSQILSKEVFLVQTIEEAQPDQPRQSHLTAFYLLRPTEANFQRLREALAQPKFGHYFLYFTNTVAMEDLQKLAGADIHDLVRQVYEVYLDYYPINGDLFSLEIPSLFQLLKGKSSWGPLENALMTRQVDGLFALLLSLRRFPLIRYQKSSDICALLADRLHERLRKDVELLSFCQRTAAEGPDPSTVLLIIDRREDPVTPLLHQWTYQAMLHELVGISHNRVKPRHAGGEMREVALNSEQDKFYADNMFQNFGDLAMNIQAYVEHYQHQKQTTSKIESIEDMKRFVETYSDYSRLAGNVSKHVALSSELDHAVKGRQLLNVSEIEQDIACNENRSEQYRQITEVLAGSQYDHLDKLKLVILYALRYEGDDRISTLKSALIEGGLQQDKTSLVDAVLRYAGTSVRSCDLFSNKNLLARAKNNVKMVLGNVPNVYTQHQPYLTTLLEQLTKGKLREAEFPATAPYNSRER